MKIMSILIAKEESLTVLVRALSWRNWGSSFVDSFASFPRPRKRAHQTRDSFCFS